jgi:hypothetical protein
VLRRMFAPQRVEVQQADGENFVMRGFVIYSPLVLMFKSWTVRWVRHVVRIREFHVKFLHEDIKGSPLCSSGQSSWLQIQRSRVPFLALSYFLRCSGSGTGSTQPRENN